MFALFQTAFTSAMDNFSGYQYGTKSGVLEFFDAKALPENLLGNWYTVKDRATNQEFLFVNLTFHINQIQLPTKADI